MGRRGEVRRLSGWSGRGEVVKWAGRVRSEEGRREDGEE